MLHSDFLAGLDSIMLRKNKLIMTLSTLQCDDKTDGEIRNGNAYLINPALRGEARGSCKFKVIVHSSRLVWISSSSGLIWAE